MKLLCAEYNKRGEDTFVVVGDNALLRNNDDFYVPSFARELSCVPQLVLRVCKIGKGVSERFASRYYEEGGLGIRFYADELERDLVSQGLPSIAASSFDGSAVISRLSKLEMGWEKRNYSLRLNGTLVFQGNVEDLPDKPEQLVARMTKYYMLKIGDFIYCGNSFRLSGLRLGDHLQGFWGDDCVIDFYIR